MAPPPRGWPRRLQAGSLAPLLDRPPAALRSAGVLKLGRARGISSRLVIVCLSDRATVYAAILASAAQVGAAREEQLGQQVGDKDGEDGAKAQGSEKEK